MRLGGSADKDVIGLYKYVENKNYKFWTQFKTGSKVAISSFCLSENFGKEQVWFSVKDLFLFF